MKIFAAFLILSMLVFGLGASFYAYSLDPTSDYGVSYTRGEIQDLMKDWKPKEWQDYSRAGFWGGAGLTSAGLVPFVTFLVIGLSIRRST